ncbi:MAG: tyrosine--tRNA ligase [Firmicutes bacterium]|nr:tyrosine--tRNA ligase [Bacillota bacterium]
MNNDVFRTLSERGYVYQCTNQEAVKKRLASENPITFYLGIDPTADSLHIGHFFALMMFRHLQEAGHKGILVIGGATALVGDPSSKNDMRKMLTKDQVQHNLDEVKELSKRFIKVDGDNPAIIINNADWFNHYPYVDFMREIGIHFNINKMLAADAYANRLSEGGLTFLEMGYMLMQAYDFVYLNREYGCTLQIGGSDQWGNIVAGTTLNRKLNFIEENIENAENDIYGLTNPLLLTKEGNKMGKTESGALWVARDKTTPYDFYQYFYNINDEDVDMLLRLFTRLPLDEINRLINKDILEAKRTMAYEITKLVHGQDEADKVIEAVNALFKAESDTENAPKVIMDRSILENGIPIIDFLVNSKFLPSKSEARRMVKQGGISLNGNRVEDLELIVKASDVTDNSLLLKRGKKNFLKVIFE